MIYAIINNGIVENIIVLTAKAASAFPNAVPCGDYPVVIGDIYDNGIFYRNGEPIKTIYENMAEMNEALAILGVTDE